MRSNLPDNIQYIMFTAVMQHNTSCEGEYDKG